MFLGLSPGLGPNVASDQIMPLICVDSPEYTFSLFTRDRCTDHKGNTGYRHPRLEGMGRGPSVQLVHQPHDGLF